MYFYYFLLSSQGRHTYEIKHSLFSLISPALPSSSHRLGSCRNHIPREISRLSVIMSFCPLASVFSMWVARCEHNFLAKFSSEMLESVGKVLQLLVSELQRAELKCSLVREVLLLWNEVFCSAWPQGLCGDHLCPFLRSIWTEAADFCGGNTPLGVMQQKRERFLFPYAPSKCGQEP